MRRDLEALAVNAFKAEGAAILAAEIAAARTAAAVAVATRPCMVIDRDQLRRLATQLADMAAIAREYHLAVADTCGV